MFLASNFGLQDVTPQTGLPTSDCSATASSLLRGGTAGRQLYITHGRTNRLSRKTGCLRLGWHSSLVIDCGEPWRRRILRLLTKRLQNDFDHLGIWKRPK